MTSYKPFGFSKVAYVHVLSRQPHKPETCKRTDNFCQSDSGNRDPIELGESICWTPLPFLPLKSLH
jgi:hypothetical protein